jgi:subtilisin family serine protease
MKKRVLNLAIVGLILSLLVDPSFAAYGAKKKETVFRIMGSQSGATWGLDRIDGTRDGSYTYQNSGDQIRIYIVDTGVDANHPDLRGRVIDGFDAFSKNLDQTDCNGHGTHVAGVAAGTFFGVAKKSTIIPVRVLGCDGTGTTTTLLSGINWIISSHGGGVGIVNMSLGGTRNEEVNSAVARLISAGLVVVAAAGNSNVDACTFSPASAPGVVAVGATDINDIRSSFSNWGSCVDVFAPGSGINSANSLNYDVSARRSGTSQAAPFVAGAIATYIFSGLVSGPNFASSSISALQRLSERDLVVDAKSANNYLVNVEKLAPGTPVQPPTGIEPPAEDPVVQPAPTSVGAIQESPGSPFGTLQWPAVQNASGYKIYKTGSIRPSWRQFGSTKTATTRTISDKPGSISIYRITAIVDGKEVEVGSVRYSPSP